MVGQSPTTPGQRTLNALWRAVFWVSFPFGILSFVLPIYGKGLGATALEVGGFFSALIPHLRSVIPLIILWAAESLGYAASLPAERAFVADVAREDTRGTSYGLYTFAFFLGSVLGPLAGGWLYDNLGQASPFYLNTVGLLIGAALVGTVLREGRATAPVSK